MSPLSSKAVISQAQQLAAQQQFLNSANFFGGQNVPFFPPNFGGMMPPNSQFPPYGAHPASIVPATQPVVLVNGLPERVTPDILFSLFGVYGDVLRVKILFQKRESALIQFSNDQQAQNAVAYLDGVTIFGNSLRVQHSNKSEVKAPREGEGQGDLNKDFIGSSLHRFKIPGSKNFQNIAPPGNMLHLTNLHLDTSEGEVVEFFKPYAQAQEVKFLLFEGKPRKMALVTFASVGECVECLVFCDGKQIRQSVVRANFAKPRAAAMTAAAH
jgi:hnRNP-L/PTB/hephaestus splicing factor